MSFISRVSAWPRGVSPISGCRPWSWRVIRWFACPFASSGLGAPVVWLVRHVGESVTTSLLCHFCCVVCCLGQPCTEFPHFHQNVSLSSFPRCVLLPSTPWCPTCSTLLICILPWRRF